MTQAQTITTFYGIPITNTLTSVAILDLIFLSILVLLRKPKFIPSFIQAAGELTYEFIEDLSRQVLNATLTQHLAPYLSFIFLFILFGNYLGLLPGMETIGIVRDKEFIPLFKGPTSDLNLTLAMGTVVFFAVHILTIKSKGFKGWIKHFFMTKPIYLAGILIAIGLLELFLEPIKYIILGVRLFGNISAGEMLIKATSQVPFVALPFYFLELLVGALQALIFTGLSVAYFATLIQEQET